MRRTSSAVGASLNARWTSSSITSSAAGDSCRTRTFLPSSELVGSSCLCSGAWGSLRSMLSAFDCLAPRTFAELLAGDLVDRLEREDVKPGEAFFWLGSNQRSLRDGFTDRSLWPLGHRPGSAYDSSHRFADFEGFPCRHSMSCRRS